MVKVITRAHALLPPHLMMHVNPRCCRRRINGAGEHTSGALLSQHALLYVADEHALLPRRRKTSVCDRSLV
jgi:hypothetical protein